jgi:amino acid adenylation domain-containing protein
MSYAELDQRVACFAAYLAHLDVGPGDAVAICMERSFDWIVAALGTMRAGAAYVPLDIAWPDTRIRSAIDDSGAAFIVAAEARLDRIRVGGGGIDPIRDAAAIAAAGGMSSRLIDPESLAYVIYTSGSTGLPKGVEITHANLSHLIRWHHDAFRITSRDRTSHLAGLGFDAAVWEIWPTLCAGATLCLADDQVRSSPKLIQEWLIRERITVSFVPTVHVGPIMEMEWPAAASLRFLLTGGESLHHAPAGHLPFCVVNNYGPAECTVVATSGVVKPGLKGLPSIGHPIMGTSVYLLNEHAEQVVDGAIGEIYIGGDGVGRGYRNLPESTKRNFIQDPFAGTPGARMYRTGDRGVRRPDGEIEFRGRRDRQIKVRGQRVELDEIDNVLALHLSIEFSITTVHTAENGEKKIVSYVRTKESACVPTSDELQQYLLLRLPAYMIPEKFVRLLTVPLSAQGKLDFEKLPQPIGRNLVETTAAKAPLTEIEERLTSIVQELLDNDNISLKDNFFLAGGHSLLGMQLVMALRSAFGVDITLRELFEAPTIQSLAGVVETILVNVIESMTDEEAEAHLAE